MAESEQSIVGDLINFRGLVYSPINENGVIFLFGKVMGDLNIYVEEIKPGFPDCIARRFMGKGWERVAIEFEYLSSNFKVHGHDSNLCDIIICWKHDWKDCPLEVLELREIIKTLPNEPVERPDKTKKITIDDDGEEITAETHLKDYSPDLKEVFHTLDSKIREISEDIWQKVGRSPVCSYYSPERVFLYVDFQKQGFRLSIFTSGQKIEGVRNLDDRKTGAKWGMMHVRSKKDLDKAAPVLKKSFGLIHEAIKNNEPTGWYAEKSVSNEGDEESDE